MNLSTIFSFSTLSGRRPVSRALLYVLGLAVVLRVCLWYRPDTVLFTAEEYNFKTQIARELRYREGGKPNPKVVILGSSRLDLVPDDWWPEYFGVADSDVVAVSRAGPTFWHNLSFLRRNPEILSEARVVVLDILPYQLYRGRAFTEEGELFLKHSTLAERMRVSDPLDRAKAVLDLAVPVWSERHSVHVWKDAIQSTLAGKSSLYASLQEEVRIHEQINRDRGVEAGLQAFRRLMLFLYTPPAVVSKVQEQALLDLCELMPPDCRILFTWLPVHRRYENLISTNEVARESDRVFRDTMQALNHPNASVIWYEDMRAMGLTRADFTDGVHYTESGLRKVCALLAQDVRKELAR